MDEQLISELAQIKALLNTLLDFQRVRLESLTKRDLTAEYQEYINWYSLFYENRLREEVGLPPLQTNLDLNKQPDIRDILDSDILE
ncbi:MAG TPA: hypothetical protein VK892_11485 [Pyrinomonadaceae bacterium]|nr:hypothetical protein [Pyrinomonadaceae bacterium]